MKREYPLNFKADDHKIIIGEGESDRNFIAEFCVRNEIEGFIPAFAGMNIDDPDVSSGFGSFAKYLQIIQTMGGFDRITDIVLMCDATDAPQARFTELRRHVRNANRRIRLARGEGPIYPVPEQVNTVSNADGLRLHALMLPSAAPGGLETICVDVARDAQGELGMQIEKWVDAFADAACDGWTVEKRDKLRLQAFMSAAWPSKPDLHFSQLFDITRDRLIPLTGAAFGPIRTFLTEVAAL